METPDLGKSIKDWALNACDKLCERKHLKEKLKQIVVEHGS